MNAHTGGYAVQLAYAPKTNPGADGQLRAISRMCADAGGSKPQFEAWSKTSRVPVQWRHIRKVMVQ